MGDSKPIVTGTILNYTNYDKTRLIKDEYGSNELPIKYRDRTVNLNMRNRLNIVNSEMYTGTTIIGIYRNTPIWNIRRLM
jgi:hypothetical protein